MSRKPRKSKSVQIAESIHRPGSGYARLLAFAISKGGRGITKAELEAYAAEIGQSKGSAGVILSPSLNNQGNWSGMGNLYFFESRKMKGTRECRYFFNLRAKALEKVRRPVKPIVETPSETGANERPAEGEASNVDAVEALATADARESTEA